MSKFRLTPSFRVRRTMRGPEAWLHQNAQYGDLLLTGGTDQISRMIQVSTGGDYSHTMIVVDNGMVIEAHDRPEESTGGVFTTPFRAMLERDGVSRASLFRAPDLDVEALRRAVDEVESTSPSFDSAGIILLGAMRAIESARRRLATRAGFAASTPGRLLQRGIDLTGDGLHRVHCAELVTRLYMRAGVPLVFERPTFLHLLSELDDCDDEACANPNHRLDLGDDAVAINSIADLKSISADAGKNSAAHRRAHALHTQRHPVARLVEIEGRLAQFLKTARGRRGEQRPADQADFVVPSDYATATGFEHLGTLTCVDGTWRTEADRPVDA